MPQAHHSNSGLWRTMIYRAKLTAPLQSISNPGDMAEITTHMEVTTNGTNAVNAPIELSIGLPSNPGTRIFIHLDILQACLTLWVASAALDAGNAGAAMGSFVFALPDVRTSSSQQWFYEPRTDNISALQPIRESDKHTVQPAFFHRLRHSPGQGSGPPHGKAMLCWWQYQPCQRGRWRDCPGGIRSLPRHRAGRHDGVRESVEAHRLRQSGCVQSMNISRIQACAHRWRIGMRPVFV